MSYHVATNQWFGEASLPMEKVDVGLQRKKNGSRP